MDQETADVIKELRERIARLEAAHPAPDASRDVPVVKVILDKTNQRYDVVTNEHGELKMWNWSSASLLNTLKTLGSRVLLEFQEGKV